MKQKIHDYLLQRPTGATPSELFDLVFTSPGNDPEIGMRFLATLLADDPRFVWRAEERRWVVSAHQALAQGLDEATFVVLDLETTGMSTSAAGIMEIGAVRVRAGRIVDEFTQLVNPGVRIPPFVARLTGIDEHLLAGEPPIREVWPRFAEFLGGDVLVAHNAGYDTGFLDAAASAFDGAPLTNPRLCSLRLARRLLPTLRRNGIDALAAEFGIAVADRHRALGDARVTAEIFFHLVEKLKARGVVRLDEALDFQNQARDGRPFVCMLPRAKVDGLPAAPGIYRFFDEGGKLLYVGKAKNLRERVWSYTSNSAGHSNKTLDLIRDARDVRVEVLGSELEAALEEAAAIRAAKPRYNRLGKHFPQIAFVRIGLADDFPRLSISKRLTTGKARFAGPFRNRKEADRALTLLTKLFRLRTCTGKLEPDPRFTPCFQGQTGACSEPCAARVSVEDYGRQVEEYLELLDGRVELIEERLAQRRNEQSGAAQFESAEHTQRDIRLLQRVGRRQARLGWIMRQRSFLILQRAVGQALILAYAVVNGFLAVRARLVDDSQIVALAAEIRRCMEKQKTESRADDAVDGTTILAAWLRDRQEDEGNVFAIDDDGIGEAALAEWRAACAALLAREPEES